jgi:hypothetical protein
VSLLSVVSSVYIDRLLMGSAGAMAAMKKFAGGQDKPVQQQGGNMQSGVSF